MQPSHVISIDAMGGDEAPQVVMDGVEEFARTRSEFHFLLFGDESALRPLQKAMTAAARCEIMPCETHIPMDMKPSQALRIESSSMRCAVEAVRDGRASAVVSAGNTGALMALSKTIFASIDGVRRPVLAASWPNWDDFTIVLDVGAAVQADARQLVEYAIMGEAFARAVLGKARPRVGILNIGTEAAKGREEIRNADVLLRASGLDIDYIGFVEGYDASAATVDVVVTDGFTGNVMVKSSEGTVQVVRRFLEGCLTQNPEAAAILQNDPLFLALRKFVNISNVNGGVFLGLNGLTVKSHGGADKYGFANAIRIAAEVGKSTYAAEVADNMRRLKQARESGAGQPAP